ncbi:MAG: acyl-CoA synthetase [Magnetospirillum sp.]|nr:acyl-CoA synthetase [Magnetospirillum sp.]
MAKRPAKPSAAPAKGKDAGVNKVVLLVIAAALVPFSLPTVTILAATMLPTLGAYFSERGSNRYAWLCIGGLNFSGVVPYLFSLWFGVHTVDEALRLLSEGNVLLWSYGASAVGWMLYKATPPVVSAWLTMTNQHRVSGLKAAQRKLVEEWGEEVVRKTPAA